MQAHSLFIKRSNKLKNNQKSDQRTKILLKNHKYPYNKFQDAPKISTQKKIIQSFKKIGKCLNHINCNDMAADGYDKVCFIIINILDTDKNDSQETAMNDGYLFGIYLHHLGFKVFYLNNSNVENYSKYLQFFLNHATESLTVYYSDNNIAIDESNKVETEIKDSIQKQFSNIIANHENDKCKVVLISDCLTSGSIFNIHAEKVNSQDPFQIISFSVDNESSPNSKDNTKSHRNFTYYFCKFIYECPDITPKRLVERMNSSINPFNETFICETTKQELENEPIFEPIQRHN